VLFNFGLKQLGGSTWAFLISLPFPFLVLHMAYAVYGKRLHDMGRSFWPLTAMIVSLIGVAIIVMLSFGGSEYFAEFSQYERKEDIDPAVKAAIQERYQARLAEGNGMVSALMWAIIGGFTLWCGLSKAELGTNKWRRLRKFLTPCDRMADFSCNSAKNWQSHAIKIMRGRDTHGQFTIFTKRTD